MCQWIAARRATIARIARRVGVSRGRLLVSYPDQPHAIADGATSLMVPAVEVWDLCVAAYGSRATVGSLVRYRVEQVLL